MSAESTGSLPFVAGLVSVVMPAHNSDRYVGEAIESVLAQTYDSLELIVVDDGSTDGTASVARSHAGVRCVEQPHKGIGAARNRGVAEAHGEFLAFLDADDLWVPEKLSWQVAALMEQPGLDLVAGMVEQFAEPGVRGRFAIPSFPQPGYVVGAITIRRTVFDATGGFPEDTLVPDVEWMADYTHTKGGIFVLPRIVMRRRIHGDNQSIRRRADTMHDTMQMLRASIARKRDERTGNADT